MNTPPDRSNRGFTLVEVLIVIVILGVLSVVVVFSVRGVTDRGEEASCGADSRTLTQAAAVYLAQEQVDVLPAVGASDNRYELTLIDAGFIVEVSARYDLQADGTVTTTGEPCT